MITRKQRQDALDKLNKERVEKYYFSPTPKYPCLNCGHRFYDFNVAVKHYEDCVKKTREAKKVEENKMIENQKINLLDRALEYSKVNQISLAEAQQEINRFMNPPICPYAAYFGATSTRCTLPANHTGHHQDAHGSDFYLQRDETC